MIDKVIEIELLPADRVVTRPMHQWDIGQIIKVTDMEIEDGTPVDIGNRFMKGGLRAYMLGNQVTIPAPALQQERDLIAYVVITDENSETTVKEIFIPVIPRPKPEDYVDEEIRESTEFQYVMQAVGEVEANAKAAAEAAKNAADSETAAGNAATAAGNAATAAAGSATSADANAKAAAASEQTASGAATTATEKAAEAGDDATAAADSAAKAKVSETNAAASETAAKTSEDNAKASESNAASSEQAAKEAAETAKAAIVGVGEAITAANEAKAAATDAVGSATAAGNSETAADTSAKNAAASEQAAGNSATEAINAAAAAGKSETNAAESEKNAKSAENTAETKAAEAEASAESALNSKNAAAESESKASDSAAAAQVAHEEAFRLKEEIEHDIKGLASEEYVNSEITSLKADVIQQVPLFANSIDECTDTTKVYVLPDGYIYGQIKTVVEGGAAYTNKAEPLPDNTTDTTKWVNGYRFDSGGNPSAQAGTSLSNKVQLDRPLTAGDVIRIKGVTLRENADRVILSVLTASGTEAYPAGYFQNGAVFSGDALISYDGLEDGVYTFTIGSYGGTINYFRFAMPTPTDASAVIVTVNEEIVETEPFEGYAWGNTGIPFVPADYEDRIVGLENDSTEQAENISDLQNRMTAVESGNVSSTIPEYWVEYLEDKIATIKALQDAGGKDCYSFITLADMHYPSNLGKLSPKLAKKIIDAILAKYAIDLGDSQTRGCHTSRENLEAEVVKISEMLAPLFGYLLRTEGNHDFSFGKLDRDGDGTLSNTGKEPAERETYVHNLTPAEMYERMYRQNGFVGGTVHTDASGTACYVDDTASKTRYIILNTQKNDYELQADGTQKYPKMWLFHFTQTQFDFLINEALVKGLTDEWTVQVFGHCSLFQEIGDREVMQGVLKAYKDKTTYTGSYAGVSDNGYYAVSVNVDFTNAKGEFVGYIHGHNHTDNLHTSYGFNIIGTRCDAKEENDATLKAERVIGTITEQSFDVFTVNKAERKIYVTKIGAGSDRVIDY